MSRRKSDDTSEGSLDLLLDTVTNAFGGILFLTILVVIQLQIAPALKEEAKPDSPPPPPRTSQAELVRLKAELAAEQSKLARLNAAWERLQPELDRLETTPEQRASEAEAAQAESRRDERVRERLEGLQQLGQLQVEIDDAAAKLVQLDIDLAAAEKKLEEAKQRLAKELAARSRGASLPQLKTTSKREVGLVVKYGRLYFKSLGPPPLFGAPTFNTEDFAFIGEDDKFVKYVPLPTRGLAIAPGTPFAEALGRKLQPFDAGRHYFAVGIWHDSFAQFRHLRTQLVKHGFMVRIIPLTKDSSLIEDSNVKDPRVQ